MFHRGVTFLHILLFGSLFSLLSENEGLTKPARSAPVADLSRRIAKLTGVRIDPALASAAGRHARQIAKDTGRATRQDVKRAVEREGLADALLLPFSSVGHDRAALEAALLAFAEKTAKPRGPTHVGIALVGDGATKALVAIFSRRLVELAPLAARVPLGTATLRGRAPARRALTALLLGPCRGDACEGAVRALPVTRRGDVLRVDLPVDRAGWYVAELLTDEGRGPETAALWRFSAGAPVPPPPRRPPHAAPEAQIRAAREDAGLAPLARSAPLDAAARAHAEAACRAQIAAHVLRPGDTPRRRAAAAGYRGAVTENVAIATTAAEAHHNIMGSPGHRRNVLDPVATELGIGVAARETAAGLAPGVCLVELFGHR